MTGVVSLLAKEVDVSETDLVAKISFLRSGDLIGAVTINYEVVGDEATAGTDFVARSGSVIIPANAREAFINVEILDDELSEMTESFIVSILSVDSGILAAPRTTRVNTLDDENPVTPDPDPPLISRYTVNEVTLIEQTRVMEAEFMPGHDNILVVAERYGQAFTWDIDTMQRQTFIDLRSEVNFGAGHQGMALHPDFGNNPYVYLYYSVDPPETAGLRGYRGQDGHGNRFSWLVRVEADPETGYRTAVPGSRTVLLGGAGQTLEDVSGGGAVSFSESTVYRDLPASDQINLSAEEIAAGLEYRQNLLKNDGDHPGGGMTFGPDGMLYFAVGDNAAFNYADPRAFSIQDIDSLNGKVLRLDPLTGQGIPDNPFYQEGDSLDLNRSKVFQYGLRNPFTITFSDNGDLIITDVGHSSYEEINIGAPGANFGWPFYEGADNGTLYIPPNFRPTPENGFQDEWDAFLATDPVVTTPFRGFSHREADPGFQIQAITGGGFVYSGKQYPASLKGKFFFSDYSDGDTFIINPDNRQDVEFLYHKDGLAPIRFLEGPDRPDLLHQTP